MGERDKTTYFKAYVCEEHERFKEVDGEIEYFNCILTHTRHITTSTLSDLKALISKEYFNLDKPVGADVQIFENHIEITYEGEHDYRTPKDERVDYIVHVSIYISEIIESEINLNTEELFKNIPKY